MPPEKNDDQTLDVNLVLTPRDRAIVETAAPLLMQMAHGALDDFDGEAAAVLAYVSKLCDRLSAVYDITESQQAAEAKRKPPTVKTTHGKNGTPALVAMGGQQVKREKHVRGDNGLCKLLHEGRPCTYEFKRKPRAGSVAAKAAEAAAATGALLVNASGPVLCADCHTEQARGVDGLCLSCRLVHDLSVAPPEVQA